MNPVNVGIVGVGNCASSLVQGVQYYAGAGQRPGLTHAICAGYTCSDIRFSAAFDVDTSKIGRDLSVAIGSGPNNALQFADVPVLGVAVLEGVRSDGVSALCADKFEARGDASVQQIAEHLRRSQTHVLVNFLPAGSQRASELYADAALQAGCGFVNCMPAVIARSESWAQKFRDAGLPLMGDDLKSQFGATLVHHALIETLQRNGVQLRSTYQIVSGGNMDFLNLQDPERIKTKSVAKLQGMLGRPGEGTTPSLDNTHFGAEYMPFLKDRKIAFIRLEGEAFGGTPLELELRMEVEDSPSAAGNVLDAVRYMKRALDHGISGVIEEASLLMKAAPPKP